MAITLPIPQFIRRNKKKSIAAVIVLVLLGFGVSRLMQPKAPEYLTAIAAQGELRQTVEAVGTVVSERDLELRFASSGIVAKVYVREGDKVQAGQRLAELKAGSLAASVASQKASLDSAQSDLNELLQGTRPEDIAIAQADLDNKKASLQVAQESLQSAEQNLTQSQQQVEILQQEAKVNLAGQVTTSLSDLRSQITAVENSLSTIDGIFNRTDVNDALVKSNPNAPNDIRMQKNSALTALSGARDVAAGATDYSGALDALARGKTAASQATGAMDSLFALISSLQETQYFTNSVRETLKTSIASERSNIQTAADSIASTQSTLNNASATYDTKIASQKASLTSYTGTRDKAKADILTYQSAVRSTEASLQLKMAGARQTDIDSARARVRAAQANLARSAADYSDTILTAPVNGTVTHVNIRIGESLPVGAAITLLGESPYRVEMFVSEIDIPKVQLTQSGSIELDAFRGDHIALRVGDIDPAATDKDGVPKYRVRLDFVHPHTDLKIGMTGDGEITTGLRADVVSIPNRAVLEDDAGKKTVRVLKDDGTLDIRPVETGMEGASGDIEIVSGIEAGDTVVVLVKQ